MSMRSIPEGIRSKSWEVQASNSGPECGTAVPSPAPLVGRVNELEMQLASMRQDMAKLAEHFDQRVKAMEILVRG